MSAEQATVYVDDGLADEGSAVAGPDLEAVVDRLAKRTVELRLELPVSVMLEAHLPLASVLHTAVLFFEPLAGPFLGAERLSAMRALLSDRRYLELMLVRIRHHARAGGAG